MSDHSELKTAATRVVEVQTTQDVPISKLFDEFDALASPEAVLELIDEVEALREEVRLSDRIIADRDRLLSMFECPDHGQCVPYAMERVVALRKDADRYQWLRNEMNDVAITFGAHSWEDLSGEFMDNAVDAAMGEGEQS